MFLESDVQLYQVRERERVRERAGVGDTRRGCGAMRLVRWHQVASMTHLPRVCVYVCVFVCVVARMSGDISAGVLR